MNGAAGGRTRTAVVTGGTGGMGRVTGSLGIRFVNIAPGAVNIPINAVTVTDPELLKRLDETIPLGRIAQPAEIADVAVLLASDKAGYVNATTPTAAGNDHYDVLVIGIG